MAYKLISLELAFCCCNVDSKENLLPLEWEYADDVDFVDEEKSNLEYMLPICKEILEEWNLFVNESKTEFTHFYLADKNEVDDKGEPLRGREPWRSSISLGSKLCSSEDVNRRCVLANSAFQNYNKVWEQGNRIPLKTRLKIYEAQVVSILMYNCNSWAASKQLLHNLDVCHRNHLRRIINMTYPNIIRNKTLYKRCDTVPLSERVGCAWWRMLGHILRSDNNSPAQLALHFAVESQSVMKDQLLPLEWDYTADVDFLDEDEENLQALLLVCKEILEEWNSYVNKSKTEFTAFYVDDDTLYKKCNSRPLSKRVEYSRGKMFGHMLLRAATLQRYVLYFCS
ncbi:hypothetical protein ACHWQZ_G019525 [Mnemiopsis leidyi]